MNPQGFQFKQFFVGHDQCGMKVGTDGILLGAWTSIEGHSPRILDLGTGTGLIALMLAQRFPRARIVAIEIDAGAAAQAADNVARSPWSDRISVRHESLEQHAASGDEIARDYDAIVCNPPFFGGQQNSPNPGRQLARQGEGLDLIRLLQTAHSLTRAEGVTSLILPAEQWDHVQQGVQNTGWHIERCVWVVPRPEQAPKRILILLSKTKPAALTCEELLLETGKHQYSKAFRDLTEAFYLWFPTG